MPNQNLQKLKAQLEKIDEEAEGDFGKDFPDYKWEFKSQEFTMPDLASFLTTQKDRVNDMETAIVKQLTEVLSKSIKEIKVTVIVLKKGKEVQRYPLTSYIVDYNKEIALSPPGAGK